MCISNRHNAIAIATIPPLPPSHPAHYYDPWDTMLLHPASPRLLLAIPTPPFLTYPLSSSPIHPP